MRILTLHCDYIKFKPVKEAIKKAEKIEKKETKVEECLVSFIAVEKNDNEKIAENVIEEIKNICEQVKANKVVVYPYAHLSSELAESDLALKLLKKIEKKLKKEFEVARAPFGWYKSFELKVKGHPLAELSREITEEKEKEKEEAKTEIDSFLCVMPDGKVLKENEVREEKIIKLIKHEKGEKTNAKKETKLVHIELAKKLKIASYEPVADAGCLRFWPKGAFIKELIRRLSWKAFVERLKAMPLLSPTIIRKEDKGVLWLIQHFPERHYKVLPGKKEKKVEMFLRTAGDYGSFSTHRDIKPSYKALPLALYENERDFRYEQRGELRGLHRLREFEMHNIHTLTIKKDYFEFFKNVFEEIIFVLNSIGLKPDAFVFYCKKELYKDYEDYLKELAERYCVPVLVELLKKVEVYMGAWIDYIVFDSHERPMEVGTAQIDFISAKNWGIVYKDKDNKEKVPIIIHAGFGAERAIAALLELIAKGKEIPLWLWPVQLRLIPVSEKFLEETKKIAEKIEKENIRLDVDDRPLHVEKKIREAEIEKIPLIGVVGKKELKNKTITIREKGMLKEIKIKKLVEKIKEKTSNMPFLPLALPKFLSRRAEI